MATLSLRNPNGYDGSPGTQYKQGIVRFATETEASEGTATNVAVTPALISDTLSSPGPIGNVTPNTGTFTNLTVNDIFAMDGGAVTDFIGTATLVAGTVTVANTAIAAADRISITRNALNASPALGHLIYTITPGVSFTVSSFSATGVLVATDVSGFSYTITRQV